MLRDYSNVQFSNVKYHVATWAILPLLTWAILPCYLGN